MYDLANPVAAGRSPLTTHHSLTAHARTATVTPTVDQVFAEAAAPVCSAITGVVIDTARTGGLASTVDAGAVSKRSYLDGCIGLSVDSAP